MTGQGWSSGVNKSVAIKKNKMGGGHEDKRRKRSGWGQRERMSW